MKLRDCDSKGLTRPRIHDTIDQFMGIPPDTSDPFPDSGLRLAHLGVSFQWHHGRGVRFDESNLKEERVASRDFITAARPVLKRQGRDRIEYWDAMTYLETSRLPAELEAHGDTQLAVQLITMLGRRALHADAIEKLARHRLFQHARSTLAVFDPEDFGHSILPDSGPRPEPIAATAKPGAKRLYRRIEVNMTGFGQDPQRIDWRLLTVWAVLLQLHTDLQTFYEIGYNRIQKCAWRGCGAWFASTRMGTRSKFCCANCRVASNRAEAALTREG